MKVDTAIYGQAEAGNEARRLEALGYDGGFTFEGPHDPFFPLVLAAQKTEHMELYTAVAIAFARNPMVLANIGWDLQALSKGRFLLGLGSQIRPHIERRFSMPWSKPAARMREMVLAIKEIWRCFSAGGRLDFRGEFYQHTLMTPMFNPGPNPYGAPPIFLAGVGPRMTEVAGEVADGFFVHPFHTAKSIDEVTLPALERGLARAGRGRKELRLSYQVMIASGSSDEEIQNNRRLTKQQIGFYASTPAYRVVLDAHGWGDLQPRLNALSKQGRWGEMTELVSDEVLETVAVCCPMNEVAARLRARGPRQPGRPLGPGARPLGRDRRGAARPGLSRARPRARRRARTTQDAGRTRR
jgi:probable F420-dependent oxidoreductase